MNKHDDAPALGPCIRTEVGRGSADRLIDICMKQLPLPQGYTHIAGPTPRLKGAWLVDLPPDVPVIVVVEASRDPYRPNRYRQVVYVYRNKADRDLGTLALLEEYDV